MQRTRGIFLPAKPLVLIAASDHYGSVVNLDSILPACACQKLRLH
jgi:hypothetical protein